jgi:hypothetical protein
MQRIILISLILFSAGDISFSQVILKPNYGLKSHETLEIEKIETTLETTVIHLTVENRIINGSFCADRNIFIIYPDGSKNKLLSAEGIPVCPDSHKFRAPGEKLSFSLNFPAIKEGTEWIDLVEDCSENCFSFFGVALDNELNSRLNKAFLSALPLKPEENAAMFRSLLDSIDGGNNGIEGLLYINIINAYEEAGDKVNSMVWYKRLVSSKTPRKESYLKYLNNKGIKF